MRTYCIIEIQVEFFITDYFSKDLIFFILHKEKKLNHIFEISKRISSVDLRDDTPELKLDLFNWIKNWSLWIDSLYLSFEDNDELEILTDKNLITYQINYLYLTIKSNFRISESVIKNFQDIKPRNVWIYTSYLTAQDTESDIFFTNCVNLLSNLKEVNFKIQYNEVKDCELNFSNLIIKVF